MKSKKIKMICIVALISIAMLSLCYRNNTKKNITLTFGMYAGSNWDVPNGNGYQMYEDVIKRFEKKYPNVNVEFISGVQKKDYSQWLSKEMLKGQTPDVFMVLGSDLATFANAGALMNLDRFVEDDKNFSLDEYYSPSLKAGQYKHVQYALPFESVPTLMFVNKTLLRMEGIELPANDWTWDDFYRICDKVTKDQNGDGKIDQFGVYGYDWKTAVFSNGATLFQEDGTRANLSDQNVVDAVNFTKKLTRLNQNMNVTSQDFDEGNVVFCPMQYSHYRAYMPYPWNIKKYSNFEWDCIALPAGPNGDNISEISTISMGISSTSNQKDYAWEFLKMLTYDETTQKNIVTYSQGVSTLKKVNESEDMIETMLKDAPGDSSFEMRILSEVMEKGRVQIRFNSYASVISMIDNDIFRIINDTLGDTTTELDALQHKVNVYLKE